MVWLPKSHLALVDAQFADYWCFLDEWASSVGNRVQCLLLLVAKER